MKAKQNRDTNRKWQQELLDHLEVLRNGVQLVNNVLNTDDAVLSQMVFNQLVGIHGLLLAIDLQETVLENQVANCLDIRIAVNDIRINNLQQSQRLSIVFQNDRIVKIAQAKAPQHFGALL